MFLNIQVRWNPKVVVLFRYGYKEVSHSINTRILSMTELGLSQWEEVLHMNGIPS